MRAALVILAVSMLIFGTVNTITTKYQDITVVGTTSSGKPRTFSHPAFQSACMFLGELLCLIPYFSTYFVSKPKRPEGEPQRFRHEGLKHKLKAMTIFALPALLDSGATTLLNLGLILTYASVYQMLRGTMVVFTGILTVTLLKRKLHLHHWLGILFIVVGAAIVGASSVISSGHHHHKHHDADIPHRPFLNRRLMLLEGSGNAAKTASAPLLGNILIIAAQLLQATQFIVEEKYLAKYRVPALLAVGLEGFWGIVICAVALPILSTVKRSDGLPIDSFSGAFTEMVHSKVVLWCTVGSILSIAFFNFTGITVTKQLSGSSRATIDASRTAMVWAFSLIVGWENFRLLQVLGFIVLLSGSSLYNELIRSCLPKSALSEDTSTQEPLLGEQHDESSSERPSDYSDSRPNRQSIPRRIDQPSKYSLARSLRAGPAALSPHSLTSPARLPMLEEDSSPENGHANENGYVHNGHHLENGHAQNGQ